MQVCYVVRALVLGYRVSASTQEGASSQVVTVLSLVDHRFTSPLEGITEDDDDRVSSSYHCCLISSFYDRDDLSQDRSITYSTVELLASSFAVVVASKGYIQLAVAKLTCCNRIVGEGTMPLINIVDK